MQNACDFKQHFEPTTLQLTARRALPYSIAQNRSMLPILSRLRGRDAMTKEAAITQQYASF
jgi:hypothetical protein